MKVELFKGQNAEWYWRTVADNGNIIAMGGEGYVNRLDCLAMAVAVNADSYVVYELKRVDGIDVREAVVEVISPKTTLQWRQDGNWRVAERILDVLIAEQGYGKALAWHRECAECGMVLTVRIENSETGAPIPQPKPADAPCDICKSEKPGPWTEGEYPQCEHENTMLSGRCIDCNEIVS